MKENFNNVKEYIYKGTYIYQITKKDYCVFDSNGIIIDELTLKSAKNKIDELQK